MAERIHPIESTDNLAELSKFLSKVLRKWHWVVMSVGISWFIAFLINRYETPVYQSNAAIITKRFDSGGEGFLPGMFQDSYFRKQIEVYQEIPLLKSHDKIRETLNRLNFDISYYIEGNVKTTEIYPYLHFHVVPRWEGDHNYMTVLAEVRTIPEHIENTFDQLLPDFQELLKS